MAQGRAKMREKPIDGIKIKIFCRMYKIPVFPFLSIIALDLYFVR